LNPRLFADGALFFVGSDRSKLEWLIEFSEDYANILGKLNMEKTLIIPQQAEELDRGNGLQVVRGSKYLGLLFGEVTDSEYWRHSTAEVLRRAYVIRDLPLSLPLGFSTCGQLLLLSCLQRCVQLLLMFVVLWIRRCGLLCR